jgi:RNA polymerase sigma-54 factor
MLDQKLQQKLLQKLSPQQIQQIKLLEIPVMELEQRIKKELEENPALEEGEDSDDDSANDQDEDVLDEDDDGDEGEHKEDEFSIDDYINDEDRDDDTPYYNLNVNNYSKDDERREIMLTSASSFHESLVSQIGLKFLNTEQRLLAEYLIGNLDDDGYLRRELAAIVDDLAFLQNIQTTDAEMLNILTIIQDLDPPGVGARDLQECLLLQMKRRDKTHKSVVTALVILNQMFNEFTRKHYDKISKKLNLSEKDMKEAIDEILRLNPRPGNAYNDPHSKSLHQITPDFTVENIDGKLYVSLNSKNAPELRVSSSYAKMLEAYQQEKKKKKADKEAHTFARQKVEHARWFIDALRQRQNTLIMTMTAIVQYQKDFFSEGDDVRLRPMILKDIAEKTGLDISTISRVANSKYVQTQFGILPLKYFFSESMQSDTGEEVSTREIKKILEEVIKKEDKKTPLTDEELAEVLKTRGYPIARRTVAKYREQLNIPVGRLRKEL